MVPDQEELQALCQWTMNYLRCSLKMCGPKFALSLQQLTTL
jgi:hypothetical protein